jgi:hypothetical protein
MPEGGERTLVIIKINSNYCINNQYQWFLIFIDYTILQARLTVKDVNDERPTFINEPRPFLATVSSNPSVGELVYELMADDPDIGSSLTYILESG